MKLKERRARIEGILQHVRLCIETLTDAQVKESAMRSKLDELDELVEGYSLGGSITSNFILQ